MERVKIDPFEIEEYKSILERYIYDVVVSYLRNAWNEPWREYHGMNHLNEILQSIKSYESRVHPLDYESMVLAAFFHDCYYNPRDHLNNEDESIKRFLASFKGSDTRVRNNVVEMIESTKHRKVPNPSIIKMFWEADNGTFKEGYSKLLKNEPLIRKEFKHVLNSVYKKKRIEFLESNFGLFGKKADADIQKLVEYVNATY